MTVTRMFSGHITLRPVIGPTKVDDATWAKMSERVAEGRDQSSTLCSSTAESDSGNRFNEEDFAATLERAVERSHPKLIEAKPESNSRKSVQEGSGTRTCELAAAVA